MKTLPVYLNYTKNDDLGHICLGINPQTLCGSKSIISVVQVENPEDESTSDLCDECLDKFLIAVKYINVEPIIECDRCSYNYSSYESRSVDSMVENKVPVCKPCYEELVKSDNSGIYTEYDECEPWRDNPCDRKFDISDKLKSEFEKIASS
jgi:hypothetical protein